MAEAHGEDPLAARARRIGHGGVGLLPGEVPMAPDRRGTIAVLALALLCTSAGFASGWFWDGRNSNRLSLRQAVDVMEDPSRDRISRLVGLTEVYGQAAAAAQGLRRATADPVLRERALAHLRQLRQLIDRGH